METKKSAGTGKNELERIKRADKAGDIYFMRELISDIKPHRCQNEFITLCVRLLVDTAENTRCGSIWKDSVKNSLKGKECVKH